MNPVTTSCRLFEDSNLTIPTRWANVVVVGHALHIFRIYYLTFLQTSGTYNSKAAFVNSTRECQEQRHSDRLLQIPATTQHEGKKQRGGQSKREGILDKFLGDGSLQGVDKKQQHICKDARIDLVECGTRDDVVVRERRNFTFSTK